jgi:hypothetical protein
MTTPQASETDGAPLAPASASAQKNERAAQAILLVMVFSIPALFCIFSASINDSDIWWHLRSADWLLQHRTFPHTDPFSSYGAGKPWAAYSWLFEVVLLKLFNHLGLVGLLVYTTGMVVAITAALYHLVKRLNADFGLCALLTFVASLGLARLYSPRPWHFTILLFVLELDVLMYARRTGRKRELLWLPVLFALWSNLHIQFIDGLLVLALAAAESIAARWWPAARTRLGPAWIVSVSLVCLLATLCNPYGWGIYKVAYDLATQHGVINTISELQAIPFRSVPDFCALFLALAGAGALARSPRTPLSRGLVFETVLFALAVFLSFRSQRDIWIVCTVAAAVISGSFETGRSDRLKLPAFFWPIIAAGTALVLFAGFRFMHVDNVRLNARLAEDLPVHAAEFVRAKGLHGPLFNDYVSGGYLMWSLRQPVSIDGRAALYGTDRIDRFTHTWNAAPDWASDPDLQKAHLVIGPARAPLTQLLRLDPHFQLVYEDNVAAVFTAK